MVDEQFLRKARDKAVNGIVRDIRLAMDFTVEEYGAMLEAQAKGNMEDRVKFLEQELHDYEVQEDREEVEEFLSDPRIKKIFKI